MQRLTRAQSRLRTREAIVEAATRLFLRDGFAATPLERVAEEAGFTRGAAYSNFAGKTELGIAVVDGLYDRELQALERAISDSTDWATAVARWARSGIGDPAWAALETAVAAAAAGDPALRGATAARFARIRATGAGLLVEHCRRIGVELPVPAETAVTVVLALGLGLGLQRSADPEIPATIFSDVLVTVFAALEPPRG